MKYAIGYQLPDECDSIFEIVKDYRDHISNVYFAVPGQASARSALNERSASLMFEELRAIRDLGVTLTVLYNANCYGERAVGAAFAGEIERRVERLLTDPGITRLTTTSPFVASVVKRAFPQVKVHASVNMWIGSTRAMELLGDDFDGYYMQREYNRDFAQIARLKGWCDAHGKQLMILANSGCLYMCPFHTFHDNLVAHEAALDPLASGARGPYPSPCWGVMHQKTPVDACALFLGGSWIRPGDTAPYEAYFNEMKLATRMHTSPRRVVMAYARGRFGGNLLDLTEPSYSRRFDNHILDGARFPADWFARTSSCNRDCARCGYCQEVAQKALVGKDELSRLYEGTS